MKDHKVIIIFRTNIKSMFWLNELAKLRDKYDIFIVCDERKGNVGFDEFNKVNFNKITVENSGLLGSDDMQWRFGDYPFYFVNKLIENYDYIWMVEPDVYFNNITFEEFISFFSPYEEDFLVSYYEDADKNWEWYKYKDSLDVDVVKKTFFPITRISKKAVCSLLNERKKLKTYANDESFVASKLNQLGYKIETFQNLGFKSYSKKTFSFRKPHYKGFILRSHRSIYHPVFFNFKDYLNHLIVRKSWKTLIKCFFGMDNHD